MTDAAVRRGPRRTQDRLQRILVLLPWLMERRQVPVAEVAARFGVSERYLIQDLEVVAMCGLPPYLDELVDVWIEEGIVHVGVPRLFTRPLRLTAPEGFALLAAGRAAMTLPGADPHGPLGRALDKLAATLGTVPSAVLVDTPRPPLLDVVQGAAARAERLEVEYYSASRGELRRRRIAPQAVFAARGRWYVVADDSLAGPERTFRIDRFESAQPTGERFEHREVPVETGGRFDDADATEVVMVLPASAAWIVETYPVLEVTALDDGRQRVRLGVASERWLERLLLRAGPEAVVEAPERWRHLGADTARRLLARYR